MNCKNIFKKNPDKITFEDMLKAVTMIDNDKYILYDELYKKNITIIHSYISELKDNYQFSKQKYLDDIDFKKSITIIKQICKAHNIAYDTKRKYQNNSYKIYYIFSF